MILHSRMLFITFPLSLVAWVLFSFYSRDVHNYLNYYELFDNISLNDFHWLEPGFVLITYAFKSLGLPFGFFSFALIFFSLHAKLYIIRNTSRFLAPALMLYTSWFLLLHDSTQLRLSFAVIFFLYGLYLVSDGKGIIAFICFLLGGLFHYSIIAGLFLLFSCLVKRTLLFFVGSRSYLVLLVIFGIAIYLINPLAYVLAIFMDYLPKKVAFYLTARSEINPIGVKYFALLYLFLTFLYVSYKVRFTNIEWVSLHCIALGLFFNLSLSFNVTLSVRLSDLFFIPTVILVPTLISVVEEKIFGFLAVWLLSGSITFYYLFIIGIFNV
ncbi:EpsG family protein [Litchfieldella xinjiangensis]|uniref:EpsG family protein n=1 Tax=Litchfieldella xinjiangensis TaxID=1166948 RepID=UPI0009DF699D|nr:EpsG family protein [Halomonas xinjiangensis]